MADIINAIALACGLTSDLSKQYIDGVRDFVLASLNGVDGRLDLMPTYEELKRMAQYSLIGEGGADHTVTVEDLETSARYRIFAATNSPKIELGFYENHYGDRWKETISLQGLESQLGYYTFEILGLDMVGINCVLRYEINGEAKTITVINPNGETSTIEFRTATFTGVEAVYRYKPGLEVIAKDGTSVFVRYSANADGTGFTETWSEGQNYVGFATAHNAPTNKADYTWVFVGGNGGSGEGGKDGVGIEKIEQTNSVGNGEVDIYTITLTNGDTYDFAVTNGTNGNDGVSPTVSVSKSGKVTTITITDKNGTKTATVNDGADGSSVTVSNVSESTASGGSNVVTFSDGQKVTVKNGKDGKTPVKGTDYFTDADKTEIKNAVLASLSTEQWVFTLKSGSTVTKDVYVND